MQLNDLSVNQAPPIVVPLRFFLTAPLFGVIAGVLMLLSNSHILMSRYSTDSIIVTHAITIGVFTFVMFGALIQMLPVLAGAKIERVKGVTLFSYLMLTTGLLAMIIGLKFSIGVITTYAYVGIGSGFLTMVVTLLYAMRNINHFTATIRGMIASLLFAFLIGCMGIFLLYEYATNSISQYHFLVANIHSVWAIFGFCGLLIIGVAFQVLPMFYIAPKFKQFCKKRVVILISIGLIIWLILNQFYEQYELIAKIWIVLFFWAFATTVWIKFNRRKRPVSDVTVWYWRASSIFLTLGSFLWIFDEFFKHEYIVMVAILIGGGFILTIMIGMLYKIVPFLIWFHLNAMGYMKIPTINEMIDKGLAKVQFTLLTLSLIGFIFAFYMPQLLAPSAVYFILSMLLLEYNLIAPVRVYRTTRKRKPDFDMSAFKGA